MKKNIFVALDFSSFDKALDVANSVKNDAAGLKITNELFAICGKDGISKTFNFSNKQEQKNQLDKKIEEKLTKGYVQKTKPKSKKTTAKKKPSKNAIPNNFIKQKIWDNA